MRRSFLSHLSIYQQSLVLAILIHVIIAELFVFSVPVTAIPERPFFVFWGSFLDEIDPEALRQDSSSEDLVNMPIPERYLGPDHEYKFSKPHSDYANRKKDMKSVPKTTFLELKKEAVAKDTLYGEKVEYQPLRSSPYSP